MAEKTIVLGGEKFRLLPCPAIGLKTIGRNFALIGSNNEAGIDALIDGIWYGVTRGLPSEARAAFTREFVEWNIDATNLAELAEAFAEANSAVRTEGAGAGEA